MRLAEVSLNNFCSCQAITLSLGDFNPIVGYNNSGKSNVLRGINWLLRRSALPAHMFNDVGLPVTVEGEIDGVDLALLPPNQQAQVAPYVQNGRMRFRRRQDAPNVAAAQVRVDVYDQNAGAWVPNPAGIDNAIGVLFPEPLYIGAMEDAGEEVGKFAAKNTIGLLLKYVLEALRTNNAVALEAIQQALDQVGVHLNGPQRVQELAAFEANATNAIASFFPGLTFHVSIATPQVDDLFRGATVSLCDLPGNPRPFGSFGHGAQRSAHMALIKLLADLTQGGARGGTVVLLIDEPELYLHPQAVELLREAFKTLATQGFQIVFSTHSPLLIGRSDVLNTSVVYKNALSCTVVREKLATAAQTIANNPHQMEVIFSLENSSYLLFSDRVLIVEGKTEKMILPSVYEILRGHTLSHDRYCVIEASGTGSVAPIQQVLAAVGFTSKTIVDLDYVFKVAPGLRQVDPAAQPFRDCLAWFEANSAAHGFALDSNGLPTRRHTNGQPAALTPAEAYQLMATAMQAEVLRLTQPMLAAGIWVWTRGAIEAHLGIQKNDAARVQFLSRMKADSGVQHASHPNDIQNLIAWL